MVIRQFKKYACLFHNITVEVCSAVGCGDTSQMNGDSIQEVDATTQRNIL